MDIEEQYDKLYRYCFFKMKNAAVAEDIVQETFLRFFESKSYRDRGRPLAYLYTTARNLCMDEFRREKHFSSEERETVSAGFEQETLERLALWAAMEELSEEERELLLLRYVNGAPMQTLEALYGKSRFALRRELKKLTERLERRITDGQKD
ncbi:MAG: RNA polymerase sigma factor [Muribaculaceae bacterium]|nr:RNA polymerase sigma factor [Roseburia sp.]MCM1431450.1 RNA polymerase sigma factor [Muribaculaceae bacterium]MCM1493256.1 RNA polymerase sigma factor [Muribaculaceae bacterium]